MELEVLVLMAGDGMRFKNAGYSITKPLIKVKGHTILEWTLRSLPFVKRTNLTFAIRSEHDSNGNLTNFLRKTYGNDISIVSFNELTRGNLETAYLSLTTIPDTSKPLLVLDADNHYDGTGVADFLKQKPEAAVACFEPSDESLKWAFIRTDSKSQVLEIVEKAKVENGKPLVGFFYFSSVSMFESVARDTIDSGQKNNNEFYMSQTIQKLLSYGTCIKALPVQNVVPLGTPEDISNEENLHRLRWNHL